MGGMIQHSDGTWATGPEEWRTNPPIIIRESKFHRFYRMIMFWFNVYVENPGTLIIWRNRDNKTITWKTIY